MQLLSPRVWPTAVVEFGRFWLRRQRTLLIAISAGALLAAAAAVLGRSQQSEFVLISIAAYTPFIAALMAMSGVVSDDLASGMFLFWFQKPRAFRRSLIIRCGCNFALLSALAVALGLALAVLGVGTGQLSAALAARFLPAMLAMTLVPAALVFAFSAWGVRRDGLAAFAFIMVSFTAGALHAFDYGPRATALKALAFPLDAIMALINSGSMSLQRALITIVCHFFAWIVIGLFGLAYTERSLQRRA